MTQLIFKLLITGGLINGTTTDQAEVLNVQSKTGGIIELSPMVETRTWHATVAAGPFVFAFGGWNGNRGSVPTCEFYDSRTNM